MKIKQGDAYTIPISLTLNGSVLSEDEITQIEVYFGSTRKLWPGELTLEDGVIQMPVTQEETLALKAGSRVLIDVRVKYNSGDVHGLLQKMSILVVDASSEEVL